MDIVKELRSMGAYLVEFRTDGPMQAGNVGRDVPALWLRAADEIERLQRDLTDATTCLYDLVERIEINGGLGEYKGGAPWAFKKARERLATLPPPETGRCSHGIRGGVVCGDCQQEMTVSRK